MSVESFVHFISFGMVERPVGWIAADSYPQLFKNSFLQHVCLLRIVTQRVKMLAHLLPCSAVTGKWHPSRNSYAGPAKWRQKNGAKITSRSRQNFPTRMNGAKRVKITLPRFSFLSAADLTPKEDFEQLFNFQGPVISECTISATSSSWCVCLCLCLFFFFFEENEPVILSGSMALMQVSELNWLWGPFIL